MALSQSITIRIKRGEPSSTLTILRADGSTTWSKLHPGMELHDLAHYAVEKSLELDEAFYGLIAEGFEISDFELPREERPVRLQASNLPPVSIQTEHLINLLMTELQYGDILPDFLQQFDSILTQHNLPPMLRLTPERLNEIRKIVQELRYQWSKIKINDIMELGLE